MPEKNRETLRQEVIDHPDGVERNGTAPGAAQSFGERFDPFHDPYLGRSLRLLRGGAAATPVFYSPEFRLTTRQALPMIE
ncbi:MAG TPA: hypothetical protein VG099_15180 [Gemmataceae bacterium]|nr:hypothetical protein [Gemmataceae bacterium]